MVVEKIDVKGVAFFEPKYDPPVAADCDAPETFQVAAEPVQSEALRIHVFYRARHIEAGQDTVDFVGEIGRQLAPVIALEQPFEASMPNISDRP